MRLIRIVSRGESIDDIIQEVKSLTYTEDCEHALVRLADGKRAIVAGGRDGIEFSTEEVARLIGHSHPYTRPATGLPSDADREAIEALGQRSSYILEHGLLFKFWAR